MKMIPDQTTYESGGDPAITQLQSSYNLKNLHACAITCHECMKVGF